MKRFCRISARIVYRLLTLVGLGKRFKFCECCGLLEWR
jgi:hypothetical protein